MDSKQRESDFEKISAEFAAIDYDRDGMLSRDEMLTFLAKRNVDEEHRIQIVDELFDKCDKDGNGFVDLREFTDEYLSTKLQLQERESELTQRILDLNQKIIALKQERDKGGAGNWRVQGPVGNLYVAVKEAQNLPAQPGYSFFVGVQQGNMKQVTQPQSGPKVVFNEPVTSFSIEDEYNPLIITVEVARTEQEIFHKEITFDDICGPRDSNIFPLTLSCVNEDQNLTDYDITVVVQLTYEPNRPAQLNHRIERDEFEMRENVTLISQVRVFIDQLSQPFGFLQTRRTPVVSGGDRDRQEQDAEQNGDINADLHRREKAAESQFDNYALKVHAIVGSKLNQAPVQDANDIEWAQVLNGCLWTYFLLTCFSSLMRPDFMSLTSIGIAFLAINEPIRYGRRVFRIVLAMLLATFVYDALWLLWLRSSSAEDFENGGGAWFIRWFSSLNAYLSFFFRIVVIAVFWKVSLNYRKIIKTNAQTSDDQSIEVIMQRYGSGL